MRQPRIRRVERSYYLPVIAGGVNDRVHGICGGDPGPDGQRHCHGAYTGAQCGQRQPHLWTPSPNYCTVVKTATTSAQRLPSAVEGTRRRGLASLKLVIGRHCAAIPICRSAAMKQRCLQPEK